MTTADMLNKLLRTLQLSPMDDTSGAVTTMVATAVGATSHAAANGCRAGAVPVLGAVVLLAGLAGHPDANAAKNMDIRDGDTAIAVVSVRDQTRIRVERGRVLDVFGDIFDAKNNPGGRLLLVKDEADGEIFVKFAAPAGASLGAVLPVVPVVPTSQALAGSDEAAAPPAVASPSVSAAFGGPLKLDVKTTRGTVGLLLHPSNVVGDTLVLRVSGGSPKVSIDPRPSAGKARVHVRSVKALTLAMAVPEYATEAAARPVAGGGEEVSLWKEARFVLKARHDAPGLVGESYVLTNISASRMVIDERELYREGVLSVAVRQLALEPGESTPVWIVRAVSDRG